MVKRTSKILLCKHSKSFEVCLAIFLSLCINRLKFENRQKTEAQNIDEKIKIAFIVVPLTYFIRVNKNYSDVS